MPHTWVNIAVLLSSPQASWIIADSSSGGNGLHQQSYTDECTRSQVHDTTLTHIHRPFSGTTQASRYQKGKTNLVFTEARDSEWQWHQLGHMQVYISFQTDNHASTQPLSFLQAGCPSFHPTNSVKALKAKVHDINYMAM